jgi:uncharacterized protein YrzB (UPF0473 family)
MGELVKVIALVDEDQKRKLYHILLDEDRSFAEWLREQVDLYVKEGGRKPKQGKK